ncbi:hypothetical protein SanaruYs_10400 [Chryseotalea sanaruensis]|uniref:Uncharacterized protein n=2 Tax=Chryseotalea sanaruensis TaxID=2482724 RepID=A0A401U7F2_9BACT|nr:hypothetical protein SanaruYs_10400 [Chryseotalea sanaruensis]
MQAVKYILCFSLVIISLKTFSQKIDGKYFYCDPSGSSCKEIDLYQNKFTAKYSGDFGLITLSTGYYLIIRDTLLLFHVNKIEDDRIVTLKKVKYLDLLNAPTFSTKIRLNIVNEIGHFMPGVNVLLRNQDNEILKGLVTDQRGVVDINLSPLTDVDNILCSWLSDEENFKLVDYAGYESIVTIKLTTKGYKRSTQTGCEKYLIMRSRKGRFSLKNLDSSEILNLGK